MGFANAEDQFVDIQISEIRSGNHFFFRVAGDESSKIIDDSMTLFTENNGTNGAPCEVKPGKVVAALFNDGSSNSWYRAKIIEQTNKGKVKVLFVDHGNVAVISAATQLRPLDMTLGTDQIPAVAKEGVLAMMKVRLNGESDGQLLVTLFDADVDSPSVNEKLVSEGLACIPNRNEMIALDRGKNDSLSKLLKELKKAQQKAKKARKGMFVYGEIPEEDED